MVIDTKRSYSYTSSTIRPSLVQEYFPLSITQNKSTLGLLTFAPPPRRRLDITQESQDKAVNELICALKNDFAKQEKALHKELKQRGIKKDLALYLFLSDFIHKNKHYTPNNVKENFTFSSLYNYFTTLKYGHCGQKPYALAELLNAFNLNSRIIGYDDILGWSHGFVEIKIDEHWQILDPTFNMLFDIGVEDIIKNPYCARKVLSLDSNEFYTDCTKAHEKFVKSIVDENLHSTFKYSREWFMFMGFYPFVPPIFSINLVNGENRSLMYDIREDSRYEFV